MQEHLNIHCGIILSGIIESSQDRVSTLLVLGIMFLMEDSVRGSSFAYVMGVHLP